MRSTNSQPLGRLLAILRAILLSAFAVLCLPEGSALALSTDQDQPIYIEADSVDIDDREGVSVYQGQVDVKQGSIHLTADKVTIYQKERKADRIVATGKPVTFKQRTDDGKEVNGHALRVEYDVNREELVLINEAELTQGVDRFASDRILYDRKSAVVKAGSSALGKERVRITITPKDQ